jgi:APA family basic amino acid/polyamine antiporter
LVAALGILVNGGLIFHLGKDNWIRLFVWLAIGQAIYMGYSRYHTKLRPTDVSAA